MRGLQLALKQATNGRSRREIADEASRIAVRIWGDDAPPIDEVQVRFIDSRLVKPPEDGRILRCVLAAVGVPLTDALQALGYWPDARLSAAKSPARAVLETLRILGFASAKIASVSGRRVVIQF